MVFPGFLGRMGQDPPICRRLDGQSLFFVTGATTGESFLVVFCIFLLIVLSIRCLLFIFLLRVHSQLAFLRVGFLSVPFKNWLSWGWCCSQPSSLGARLTGGPARCGTDSPAGWRSRVHLVSTCVGLSRLIDPWRRTCGSGALTHPGGGDLERQTCEGWETDDISRAFCSAGVREVLGARVKEPA